MLASIIRQRKGGRDFESFIPGSRARPAGPVLTAQKVTSLPSVRSIIRPDFSGNYESVWHRKRQKSENQFPTDRYDQNTLA